MSYKRPFEEAMDSPDKDITTIQSELEQILDMDNIEDIKIAISNTLQIVRALR